VPLSNPRLRLAAAFLAAVMAFGPAAAAQPEPEAEDGPIVVTGTRASRGQINKMAQEFVRRTGIARGTEPAARWADPVCPQVVGLAAPFAEVVEARLRAAAGKAGLKLAGKSCTATMTVIFVEDAVRFMNSLSLRSSQRLRDVAGADLGTLLNGRAPIRWFYLSEARNTDGDRPHGGTQPGVGIDGAFGGIPTPEGATNLSPRRSGFVSTQVKRALTNATVVVDVKGVEGLPLTAVADYAALVGFAEVRPSEPPPAGSILSLLAPEARVRELTDWDLALLRTLYRMPMDRQARRHRGALVKALVSDRTKPQPN
jgi:hypothetical protein